MKKLFLLLAVCSLTLAGCKGGSRNAGQGAAETSAAPEAADAADTGWALGEDFSFDELYSIFSIFGDNIMSRKFAPQSVKESIRQELEEQFDNCLASDDRCNRLSHDLYDGDCYDGFEMACYRYKADGHVLVLLSENGGCDVSSVKYIRAYEYDPAGNGAREVELPLNPAPVPDDFEDLVRLAGADVRELRGAMKAGLYTYEYRPSGLRIQLNDPGDYDEWCYYGALQLDYIWNGAEFVRNSNYVYPCIHASGFGNISLGMPVPDLHFDYDPIGYDVKYSEGGDLWMVNLGEEKTLEIQMEGGRVYSIETRSPRYSVSNTISMNVGWITPAGDENDPTMGLPRVGGRINDCITLGYVTPKVWMLMDGTVSIEDTLWGTHIAFRTSPDALGTPVDPDPNGRKLIEDAGFKNDAKIESILIWKD
ncbi:MAG: hypothetical protein K5849_02435 [Bacteroidales bacterium]|nr:hypothetical protein [Bacteroidales bacterium]